MKVKIKLLVSRVGPTVNDVAGDEIDVDEDTAHAMCELSSPPQAIRLSAASGLERAVPPAPPKPAKPKAQKAVKSAPEKAVK